ncbi:MAG: hypothetical protein KJ914_14775 [Gammaproteobacteria bacterium]|nr:hypothetical protein [Gammaproteobacteria bacterium]MBU1723508.1 hypothetical protein [Gammaproteobacteria bacterium]MBU2007435.1 hypothetical protein [Gammaproteobacteria bacterium]
MDESEDYEYEDSHDDMGYQLHNEIDFSRIHTLLRSLALFDDVFLNMQAMNIAMIDRFATDQEYALLAEYNEIEKTPTQSAMFVSAISQMWIFSLYELLRTWRERIRKLIEAKKNGGLNYYIENHSREEMNLAAMIRADHAKKMKEDENFEKLLIAHKEKMDGVFRLAGTIRITLAKHELPGKNNKVPHMPGYARIDGFCGAMNFEITHANNSFSFLSRRDIADALRAVNLDA